jgi:isorenieratene synthase
LPVVDPETGAAAKPDWQQARLSQIDQTLKRVRKLPSGGWYVVTATDSLSEDPQFFSIDSHEIAIWKSRGKISAVINRCPHMGAPLSEGTVQYGVLNCPWHGLRISEAEHGKFLESHDDGVLTWVRLSSSGDIDLPLLPVRPQRFIPVVIRFAARCDPEDIIANRLDPWHGVHLHPHSFARLKVIGNVDEVLTVRVVFRAFGSFGVEVDCTFHCPEPNTIVMTIIDGEGKGSAVETHATPICPGSGIEASFPCTGPCRETSQEIMGGGSVIRGKTVLLAAPGTASWNGGSFLLRTRGETSSDLSEPYPSFRSRKECTIPLAQPSTGSVCTSTKPAGAARSAVHRRTPERSGVDSGRSDLRVKSPDRGE